MNICCEPRTPPAGRKKARQAANHDIPLPLSGRALDSPSLGRIRHRPAQLKTHIDCKCLLLILESRTFSPWRFTHKIESYFLKPLFHDRIQDFTADGLDERFPFLLGKRLDTRGETPNFLAQDYS